MNYREPFFVIFATMLEILEQYNFLVNASIAAILSGVACGVVGSYIVARRLVFLSGGITHSSFGGIGIAYYMGWNPILGALAFAIMSALGIEYMSGRGKLKEDSAIGILWSLGMAIGIIFVFLTPGYAPNLMTFLFGNILLVSTANLLWLAVLDVALLTVFGLFYRPIIYTALDKEYAKSAGVPVTLISYAMMVLLATAIVLNIKVVGIMLLISLLTMPVAIVGNMTHNLKKIMVLSSITAAGATLLGILISYHINIPSSATTIVALALGYGISKIWMWGRQKFRL